MDGVGEFLNTDEYHFPPKKVKKGGHASLDGSSRRNDLANRVTVLCPVFTITHLITRSLLRWISKILPLGHLSPAVPGSCTSTMSPTLGS
ncbi:hypothetical protein T10_652 [Trichinella papuae]|uniref:Uncharacterized protein n=1 Tax=Trichinella papuae TaxID=268474 RepID=A0A0V1MUH5_9BILA|nr:hypothetical protein T10_652 [Trichinella papuae]